MIHELLPVIQQDLNLYFKRQLGSPKDRVELGSIIGQDGGIATRSENTIILSVVNIEVDGSRGGTGGASHLYNLPVNVNLYLLFSAYFKPENYLEALKFISGVIGFFQAKPIFTPSNSPSLPSIISEPISVELMKLSLDQLSNLYTIVGAKYMPSVVYRLRSLSIKADKIRNTTPRVGPQI